jgi:hypothetical protein
MDSANLQPGEQAPVPTTEGDLLIEALRCANRMGGLLNEIAGWAHKEADDAWGTAAQPKFHDLEDLLVRRFSDCSAIHLFIAAQNVGIKLPPDLTDDPADEPE